MRGDESFSRAAIIDLTDDASRADVTAGVSLSSLHAFRSPLAAAVDCRGNRPPPTGQCGPSMMLSTNFR
jgi:hypothetical protein